MDFLVIQRKVVMVNMKLETLKHFFNPTLQFPVSPSLRKHQRILMLLRSYW